MFMISKLNHFVLRCDTAPVLDCDILLVFQVVEEAGSARTATVKCLP